MFVFFFRFDYCKHLAMPFPLSHQPSPPLVERSSSARFGCFEPDHLVPSSSLALWHHFNGNKVKLPFNTPLQVWVLFLRCHASGPPPLIEKQPHHPLGRRKEILLTSCGFDVTQARPFSPDMNNTQDSRRSMEIISQMHFMVLQHKVLLWAFLYISVLSCGLK